MNKTMTLKEAVRRQRLSLIDGNRELLASIDKLPHGKVSNVDIARLRLRLYETTDRLEKAIGILSQLDHPMRCVIDGSEHINELNDPL